MCLLCSYVKDQRIMNVLSVLLGVDLKEAAEVQGVCVCVCVCMCLLVLGFLNKTILV